MNYLHILKELHTCKKKLCMTHTSVAAVSNYYKDVCT